MAQLPTYDSPKVAPQAGPSGALNIQAPNLLSPVAQGGMNLVKDYREAQFQAHHLVSEDLANQFNQGRIQKLAAFTALQSGAAIKPVESSDPDRSARTPADQLLEDIRQLQDDMMVNMSPGVKKLFKFKTDPEIARTESIALNHVNQQTQVYQNSVWTGRSAVADQDIAQNGVSADGRIQADVIVKNIQSKVDAVNQISDQLKESPEMRATRELEARSGSHAIVLDALLKQNNPQGAQVYFDANRSQMDKSVVSAMEGKIQQTALANVVQTKAQDIAASGLPLDQQLARVDREAAGNPELHKALWSEVEHRFTAKKQAQAAAQQDTYGKLWDMRFPTIPGQQAVGMPQIMRSNEWGSLNGTQRNELRAQWESYSKRNENDPNVAVQRALAYFNTINDPNFDKLTDNQIKALTPSLGPQLTVQVMKDLQEIRTKPEKLQEIHLDAQVLEASAKKFGLISGDKPNDSEKMAMAQMQAQAKQIMQASGQKWSYENQQKLYEQLSQQIVTNKGWFWDTKAPLFQVRETTAIPSAFLATVKARSAALGQPMPSDAKVYELWFDAKAKGLVDESGVPVQSSSVSPVTGANK